jgi:hypothetical protein
MLRKELLLCFLRRDGFFCYSFPEALVSTKYMLITAYLDILAPSVDIEALGRRSGILYKALTKLVCIFNLQHIVLNQWCTNNRTARSLLMLFSIQL